jgi:Domain of unknown function (DUF222)
VTPGGTTPVPAQSFPRASSGGAAGFAAGQPLDAAPEGRDEFTAREVNAALHLSLAGAEQVLDLAGALESRLPGTKAAFRSGTVTGYKAPSPRPHPARTSPAPQPRPGRWRA